MSYVNNTVPSFKLFSADFLSALVSTVIVSTGFAVTLKFHLTPSTLTSPDLWFISPAFS